MRIAKRDWIYDLVDKSGFTMKDCNTFLAALAATIEEVLCNGDDFGLTGIGTFRLSTQKDRFVPQPGGKAPIFSPEHSVVRFSPSSLLKEAVKNVKRN